MTTTTVKVTRNGRPASGVKVVLGFWGGHTPGTYTNSNGNANIQHSHTGQAEVFAYGKYPTGGFIPLPI